MVWGSDEDACQTWAGSRTQGTHCGDDICLIWANDCLGMTLE